MSIILNSSCGVYFQFVSYCPSCILVLLLFKFVSLKATEFSASSYCKNSFHRSNKYLPLLWKEVRILTVLIIFIFSSSTDTRLPLLKKIHQGAPGKEHKKSHKVTTAEFVHSSSLLFLKIALGEEFVFFFIYFSGPWLRQVVNRERNCCGLPLVCPHPISIIPEQNCRERKKRYFLNLLSIF